MAQILARGIKASVAWCIALVLGLASVHEVAKLDASVHAGWMRPGHSFQAYGPNGSGGRGRSVCRWYGSPDAGLDTHFFSASYTECVGMFVPYFRPGWTRETENAFEIALPDLPTGTCAAGTIPVYRLWNTAQTATIVTRLTRRSSSR